MNKGPYLHKAPTTWFHSLQGEALEKCLGWGQCITYYERNSLPTLGDSMRFGIHSISHEVMFVQWAWVAQVLTLACSM